MIRRAGSSGDELRAVPVTRGGATAQLVESADLLHQRVGDVFHACPAQR
jgi:hypothetical protein